MQDFTCGISVEQMSRQFTPKQAARVKYRTLLFRDTRHQDPEIDLLFDNDPGHRWFLFCLDAVARRESM